VSFFAENQIFAGKVINITVLISFLGVDRALSL